MCYNTRRRKKKTKKLFLLLVDVEIVEMLASSLATGAVLRGFPYNNGRHVSWTDAFTARPAA
jgi:hypothetical protein